MYIPPFKITARILNLVAEISAKIERYGLSGKILGMKMDFARE